MRRHYILHHKNLLHPCRAPSCGKVFLKLSQLERHNGRIHGGDFIQCSYCVKTFQCPGHHDFHVDDKHPEKSPRPLKYACPISGCDAAFPRRRLLLYHERRHVKKPVRLYTPSKCPICGGTFSSVKMHIKNAHSTENRTCGMCHLVFSDEAELQSHYKSFHSRPRPNPQVVCNICGKIFKKNTLTAHKKAIHEKIRHKCPHCDKTYTSLSDMRCHARAVHEGIKLTCRFCSLIFLRGSQRNQHERQAHSEELAQKDGQ